MADEYNTNERSAEEMEELRQQAEAVTGVRMNEPVEVAPMGYPTHGADGGKYNIDDLTDIPESPRLKLSEVDAVDKGEKGKTLHFYTDPVLFDNQMIADPSKDFISPRTLAPSSSDFDSTPMSVKEKAALMSKILKKDQEQKHKPVDKLTEIDIALDDLPF